MKKRLNDLTAKTKEAKTEKISEMWAEGFTSKEIAKKTRLDLKSVAAYVGYLNSNFVE